MEEDYKPKYLKLKKKYIDLSKSYEKLKSSYLKLKENHDIDIGQINFLRKENEELRQKQRPSDKMAPKKKREPSHTSIAEEQYSQFIVKIPIKAESSGKITQVKPDQSVYLDSSEVYIYQGFYIIGPDEAAIASAHKPLTPEIQYEYYPPGSTIGVGIKSIIPTLCFPQGVISNELHYINPKAVSIIDPAFQHKRTGRQFVVTVRNDNPCHRSSTLPNSEHELLYICCLEFDDLILTPDSKWLTSKCYSIASFIPAFELHFSILSSLVILHKSSDNVSKLTIDEQLLLEIYKDCEELYSGRTIQLGIEKIDMIRYKCPYDLGYVDVCWTCLPLVNSLQLNDLLWVMFSVSQEKSVVFVSESLGLVTACVLAVHCLLRPLKWPNLIMPLVPESLEELLEAPIPVLAGIKCVSLAKRESLEHINWVYLDENSVGKRLMRSKEGVEEVAMPGAFKELPAIEEAYRGFSFKKDFEFGAEEEERCGQVKSSFCALWERVIKGYLSKNQYEIDAGFLNAVYNTQMFSYSIDQGE